MSMTWDQRLAPTFLPPPPRSHSLWSRLVAWATMAEEEPKPQPYRHRRPSLVPIDTFYAQTEQMEPPEPTELVKELGAAVAKIADPLEALKRHLKTLNYGQFRAYCEATCPEGCNDVKGYMDKVWGWAEGGA